MMFNTFLALFYGLCAGALAAWTRALEAGAALADEAWTRGSLPETHRRLQGLLERRGLAARAQQLGAYLRKPSAPGAVR